MGRKGCERLRRREVPILSWNNQSAQFLTPGEQNSPPPLTLNISSNNVPLPGPNSTILTLPTLPCATHSVTKNRANNSPKTWEISGEVMKSPERPNGSVGGASDVDVVGEEAGRGRSNRLDEGVGAVWSLV